MVRAVWGGLICLLVLTLAGQGQAEDLPPAPVPVVVTTLPHPEEGPAPTPLGSPPPGASDAPLSPPPPPGAVPAPVTYAPLPDGTGAALAGPLPGWFVAVEAGAVVPHIRNELTGTVSLLGFVDRFQVPAADLDWTVSPRIELGYRFAEGYGEALISYRTLRTDGLDTVNNFDPFGPGQVQSTLELFVLDLDYANRAVALGPPWDLKWKAGLRGVDVCFSSWARGQLLDQWENNNFQGIGPHAGLDLWRSLGPGGVSLFARVEGAALFGRVRQRFEESLLAPNGGAFATGCSAVRQNHTVPTINVQAGLGWMPPFHPGLHFAAGYQIEDWWNIGQTSASNAELTVQGIFLRGEWRY